MKHLFLFLSAAIMVSVNSYADNNNSETLSALVTTWLGIESQKGKLLMDWNSRKATLDQRLELYSVEKETLSKLIQESEESMSATDQRRLELIAQQQHFESEQEKVHQLIHSIKQKMKAMQVRLPPPVAMQWEQKMLLLEGDHASASEQLEHILAMFKQADDFNQRIAVNKVSMDIAEQRIHVNQYYLGLDQAWYVSDDGEHYGLGFAGASSWRWLHNDELKAYFDDGNLADHISSLKRIIENPTEAEFITLPIIIK
ncbi:Protein of unknown function [Alteromonadaceae bacterium Bs31]|nr:Protein of unknown function [Alteromonadaceae bacterium Bs31]